MALKPCPQCGKMISDKAERCPKCGLDLRNTSEQAKAPDAQNILQQPLIEKPTANEGSEYRSNPTIIERHYQSGQPTRIDKPKKSKRGLWIFLSIILAVGIGAAIWIPVHLHNEKLLTPEEEVRKFGSYFVEKISAGQLDSIKDFYPQIYMADSIVPLKSDSIIVMEFAPNQYDVTLTEGVKLKINRSDYGYITVAESKGLFAFPEYKVDIAKKTGMLDQNLTDIEISHRINDDNFYEYLNKKIKQIASNLITVGEYYSFYNGEGYYPITNNSDKEISKDNYRIMLHTWEGNAWETYRDKTHRVKGKNLGPNETFKFRTSNGSGYLEEVTGISIEIPEKELFSKYINFSGNEYQEYLDLKK